jgi:hypothetical protein
MNDTRSAASGLPPRASDKMLAEEFRLRNRFLLTGCGFFVHLLLICVAAVAQDQVPLPLLRELISLHCAYQLPLCCLDMSGLWASLIFAMYSEHKICNLREDSSRSQRHDEY